MRRTRNGRGHLQLLAACGLSLLAACSDDDAPRKDAGVGDGSIALSTIVIGTNEAAGSLDPGEAYSTGPLELLMNINRPLYIFNPDTLTYDPALAAGDPVITDGGLTWTIALKQGLKFADGTDFTAASIKYSVDRTIARQGQPVGLISPIESVTVVDDSTIRFKLTKPTGYFLAILAAPVTMPINAGLYPEDKLLASPFSQAAYDNVVPDTTPPVEWSSKYADQNSVDATKLLGLGPYRIASVEFDATVDTANNNYGRYKQITLAANPNYYAGKPPTDRIVIKYYADSAALAAALQASEIQVAWNTVGDAELETLAADARFVRVESGGVIAEHAFLNHRVPPFDNANLRKAVAYIVDRPAIVDAVFKQTARALYSPVPKGLWSHVESFKTAYGATPNVDEGKKLLTDAGYSPTNKLSFEFWYGEAYEQDKFAAALKKQLEATGLIAVTLRNQEINAYFGSITGEHSYPMFWLGWTPDYNDPDTFLYTFGPRHGPDDGDLVSTGYQNETVANLLKAARAESSFAIRRRDYEQVQDAWARDVISLPVAQRTKVAVVRQGFTVGAPGTDTLLRYETVHAD